MMCDSSRPTLEILPNEILLDICKYLTARELYRAFDDLNHRFRLAIDSASDLHLTMTGNDQSIRSTLRRVIKLSIDRVKHVDLCRFSNIRSLEWIGPSNDQVQNIYSAGYFSHLEQLSIHNMKDTSFTAQFYQFIFSNGFPFLRKCNLSRVDISRSWTFSPSLRSIKVSNVNDHLVFERILASCPNMTRLDYHVLRCIHALPSSTFRYFNLKKLYLTGNLSSQSLDNILAHVPALIQLYVKWTVHEPLIAYFEHLSNTFNHYVPYLCRFDCDFLCNGKYDDFRRIEPVLEQLHPCFTDRLQFTAHSYDRVHISTK